MHGGGGHIARWFAPRHMENGKSTAFVILTQKLLVIAVEKSALFFICVITIHTLYRSSSCNLQQG